MEDFTLSLALYDFVPVLLTGFAVYFIARVVQAHGVFGANFAFVGAALIVAAGVSKAVWKLNATLTGHDFTWLANLLFPLMAPGFALLAAGIWGAQRSVRAKSVPAWLWIVPLVLICVTYAIAGYRIGAGVERGWFMPIMSLASLANITLTVLLFMMAWRYGQRAIAILFTVNLAMVFALIPIAQLESHSIAVHWLEQTLTAIGAGAFAFASFCLYKKSTLEGAIDSSSYSPSANAVRSANS